MAVVCVLVGMLCGYAVADANDRVPGLITLAPSEDAPQPYPAVRAASTPVEQTLPNADLSAAAAVDKQKVQGILENMSTAFAGKGDIAARVLDARTGAELGVVNAETSLIPASNMKLLTAFAALRSLGAEKTFATSVVRDGESLYLVGGGDIALAPDAGDATATLGRAGLGDLARAVAKQLTDVASVQVFVDTSSYGEPEYEPSLPADSRSWVMSMSPIAMHLGKVSDDAPDGVASSYPADPAAEALEAFVQQLDKAGVKAHVAGHKRAPEQAISVAAVHSAPVRSIVDYMLLVSENSLAETLAHQVAIARGKSGNFEGGATAVSQALKEAGLDIGDSVIRDGSGLSLNNRVSPTLLTDLLSDVWACSSRAHDAAESGDAPAGQSSGSQGGEKAQKDTKQTQKDAGQAQKAVGQTAGGGCPTAAIGIGIPIGGIDGSLRTRFTEGAGTALVHAKTGSLDEASSLSGFVLTQQGRPLIFSIVLNTKAGMDAYAQRPIIDEAVTALAEL